MFRPPAGKFFAAACAAVLGCALPRPALSAPECGSAQRRELLEAASAASPAVDLKCSLKLDEQAPDITKTVRIHGREASGVTLDCGGSAIQPRFEEAALEIYSDKEDGGWSRPENVTVKNCRITGRGSANVIKVWGGSAFESSHSLGHTGRMQAAAPKNIVLSGLTVTAAGGIPLYVYPGVTRLSLLRSEISGTGSAVAIYLDAETGHNIIRDSHIHLESSGREQLAVDGSAHNLIVNNRFSGLNTGGIYLYRNCGEKGTVRHQSPSHNQIINNVFHYRRYLGGNPAIWVASRNRKPHESFCDLDIEYKFGSGARDQDDARFNVIAQNRIYLLPVTKMIRVRDAPTYLYENRTVQEAGPRAAGCYVGQGMPEPFIHDGQNAARRTGGSSGSRLFCRDGALSAVDNLPARRMAFQCSKSDSNSGCSTSFACPAGTRLIGMKLGCNLELSELSPQDVSGLPWDAAKVFRPSDNVRSGQCGVRPGPSLSSGTAGLTPLLGKTGRFTAYCAERDANGGDCAIRGEALCL